LDTPACSTLKGGGMNRDFAEVLANTRRALEDAQRGYNDLLAHDGQRRAAGFRNVCVFGRSVTIALQHMRGVDKGRFDAWYAPYAAEMDKDPLTRFFNTKRNEILKEALPGVAGVQGHIRNFSTRDDLMKDPPPGARAFFMGDQLGGSGWEIEMADGAVEKFYVELPPEIGRVDFAVNDAPTDHLGQPILDPSATELARLYLHYLSALVEAAEAEFSR
jgi:hypothetical protein